MKTIKGFTLFEVLIAVSIFAVIGAMTMSSLIQVGRTGEKVSASQRQLSDIQFALGYLGKDIVQLVNRKIRDQYGDVQHQLVIAEDQLTFTRKGWSNLLQQNRSNLQRVEYRLEDETLQRRYWPQLDQSYEDVSITQPILQGVSEFSAKLLTARDIIFKNWPQDELNGSAEKPVAIEIILNLSDFGEVRRIYEINNAI